MSLNLVMIAKDRPRLTRQALTTLVANTDVKWNLTLVDDASQPETRDLLRAFARNAKNVALLRNETSKGILGQVKNLGIYWSERYFGRGEWLCLCDNDIAFMPKWASRLTDSPECWNLRVIGGVRHPYHQINGLRGTFEITDAVAGYCQLMRWDTWDDFGPFDAHAVGVCQSEDFAFCRKVVEAGGKVGYIDPPVIAHCGLTNTEGKPAIGSELIERVEGFIYE